MMPRHLVLLAPAFLAVACGKLDVDFDDDADSPWDSDDRDGVRTLDATTCDAPWETGGMLRCIASPSAPRVALGLCGRLDADNTLRVHARTSPTPNATVSSTALAVDGAVRVASPLRVEGDVVALGGLDTPNTIDVGGTLEVGGTWTSSSPARVAGDAFVETAIAATNSVDIGGTLHIPAGTDLKNITMGDVSLETVEVGSELACTDAVDVASVVARAIEFDGASSRLPRDILREVDAPSEVTIGCGTYRVSSIGADNTLTIRVVGAAVLVVENDFRVASPVRIVVESAGSLDLAIGGALRIDNTLVVDAGGNPDRVWVGVAGGIRVASPTTIDGHLVAPQSDIAADNTLDVRGAVLARNLRVASPVAIHDGPSLSPDGCVFSPLRDR